MKIFAVSDLHLSLTVPYEEANPATVLVRKPMNIFGGQWDDYFYRLASNWRNTVADTDVVLIAGDISWAMTIEEAQFDFAYLAALPGKKIISRGNHDYWWKGITKLRSALPQNIFALQHDAIDLGDFAVCATRGWLLPHSNDFEENIDRKVYERELLRLEMALCTAARFDKQIIVMLHFPPIDDPQKFSGFADLLFQYPVRYCVYGHIHGNRAAAFEGEYHGIRFINTSVDRIGFCPLLLDC